MPVPAALETVSGRVCAESFERAHQPGKRVQPLLRAEGSLVAGRHAARAAVGEV